MKRTSESSLPRQSSNNNNQHGLGVPLVADYAMGVPHNIISQYQRVHQPHLWLALTYTHTQRRCFRTRIHTIQHLINDIYIYTIIITTTNNNKWLVIIEFVANERPAHIHFSSIVYEYVMNAATSTAGIANNLFI